MKKRVSLAGSRSRLVTLWFAWSAVLFATLLFQTWLGHFGTRLADAWAWFVPLITPTLGSMVGTLVTGEKSGQASHTIDGLLFRLSYGLSVGYLITLTLTIYLSPFTHSRADLNPLELMKLSHLWLLPLQALTAGALGALFMTRERAAS